VIQYLIGRCLAWLPMLKVPHSHDAGDKGPTLNFRRMGSASYDEESMCQAKSKDFVRPRLPRRGPCPLFRTPGGSQTIQVVRSCSGCGER
jgi:hypothetical protein